MFVAKLDFVRIIDVSFQLVMSTDILTTTYLRLRSRLKATARRLLNDDGEAEDALQEAFCQLWQKRDKIESVTQAEGLTIVTLRNKCIDVIRNRNRQVASNIDDHALSIADEAETDYRENLYKSVKAIIDSHLSERERQIITMRDTNGFDFSDIADELHISEANARLILSRARKKVRDIYLSSKI